MIVKNATAINTVDLHRITGFIIILPLLNYYFIGQPPWALIVSSICFSLGFCSINETIN